jgi:hypothetical protein
MACLDSASVTLAPEGILDLPSYHGLVWYLGRTLPVPVYAPPY